VMDADGKRSYTKRPTLREREKAIGDDIRCMETERKEARVGESGRPHLGR
jgi:hypothetical protein